LDVEGGYWTGTYEPKVQAFLNGFCKPGLVFYDVGSSLGFFSLGVAHRAGENARIFAFEPESDNVRRFSQMITRNRLEGRVVIVEAAAWSYSKAEMPFRRGGRQSTYGGVAADGIRPVLAEGETRKVKAVSLDDFVADGHPAPHLIKIDVEGGECEVLKGAQRIFSDSRPALVCEVHRQEASDWIADWLAGMGYAAEWQIPAELFPRLLFAKSAEPGASQGSPQP
jgi:FkbM family methyltransferase